MDGLRIWRRNIDKRFEGVDDCMICFSVLHGTNFQLPRLSCRTCKKKFHSACLVSQELSLLSCTTEYFYLADGGCFCFVCFFCDWNKAFGIDSRTNRSEFVLDDQYLSIPCYV